MVCVPGISLGFYTAKMSKARSRPRVASTEVMTPWTHKNKKKF